MKVIIASIFTLFINIQASTEISKKVQLANRFLVENILIEVFGQKVKSHTTKYIIPNISVYGGPCDIYEQVRENKKDVTDIYSSCFGNKGNHRAEINVKSSALRGGLTLKTCKSIIQDRSLMSDFYKKINAKNNFSKSALVTLHKLFFPHQRITQKQIDILTRLFYSSTHDKWDAVVLSYCISPTWQIL